MQKNRQDVLTTPPTFCLSHPHPVCQEPRERACPASAARWGSRASWCWQMQPLLSLCLSLCTGVLICTSNPVSRPLPALPKPAVPKMVPRLHMINKHPLETGSFHARWTGLTPWDKLYCVWIVFQVSLLRPALCFNTVIPKNNTVSCTSVHWKTSICFPCTSASSPLSVN